MRRCPIQCSPHAQAGVYRVVSLEAVASQWEPGLRLLAIARTAKERALLAQLHSAGLSGVDWIDGPTLESGDVVALRPVAQQAVVLFRETDRHHTLLLTNRCNSYCLMCSQPPTPQDDAWLVDEALEAIRHLRISPRVLGLSGGEPLLLGSRLRKVIAAVEAQHSATQVEVLTNGRLFSNPALAEELLAKTQGKTTWLVPLYGHVDFLHDFVVQAPGAFEETLAGLLALQQYQHAIQLRIVLIEPVLSILPELCNFIASNLPFVREVALMACEPIGFALANREHCEVDLAEWHDQLIGGARALARRDVPHLVMNAPLCALPRALWPKAHQSISDWKNVYAGECAGCAVRNQCCGLFAWHDKGWKPTILHPIREVVS